MTKKFDLYTGVVVVPFIVRGLIGREASKGGG